MKFLYGFLPSMNKTTCAVLALAHGAEISEISRLLGHASTGVTERVYAEFLPDNLATVVSKLDMLCKKSP